MKLVAVICLLAMTACGSDLSVPSGVVVRCYDDGDCPPPMRCQLAATTCVSATSLDVTPPRLLSVVVTSPIAILLTFDEPLDREGAVEMAHYVTTPPLALVAATAAADGQSVVLEVERQEEGARYSLTADGVTDVAGNVIVAPDDTRAFDGVGAPVDTAKPIQLGPSAGASVHGVAPLTLQWSETSGARSYVVDVATSPVIDGTHPPSLRDAIAGSPFTVGPTRPGGKPRTSLVVTPPAAATFYWQVRADVTSEPPVPARFDVLDDTLYVFCAAAATCDPNIGAGNATAPFMTIGRAIAEAIASGVTRVAIADRGGGQPYRELVVLADGVSLSGGYGPDFSAASRASGTFTTALANEGVQTIYGAYLDRPITLERLEIHGSTAQVVHTVALTNVRDVALENVDIVGGTAQSSGIGLRIVNDDDVQGRLHIANSRIEGPAATSSNAGLFAINVATTALGSTIVARDLVAYGPESQSHGAYVNGTLDLRDCNVRGGSAAYPVGLFYGTGSGVAMPSRVDGNTITTSSGTVVTAVECAAPGVIANNVIDTGSATVSAAGVALKSGAQDPLIINNTIGVGPCPSSITAISVFGSAIVNNVIFARGTGERYCIGVIERNPTRVENNLYFACPDGALGSSPSFTELADINDCATYPLLPGAPQVCRGNFTDASAPSFFASFASADYHLVAGASAMARKGGIDASAGGSGGVTSDRDGNPRTCPSPGLDCVSVGAYERD